MAGLSMRPRETVPGCATEATQALALAGGCAAEPLNVSNAPKQLASIDPARFAPREAGFSALDCCTGTTRREHLRTLQNGANFGSILALPRMAALHWQQPIYHPGGVSGVIISRSHW